MASFPVNVSWLGWRQHYQYAPCKVGPHAGKYVALCPQGVTPPVPVAPSRAAPERRDFDERRGNLREATIAALADHGLDQVEPWRAHLSEFEFEEPVHIRRSDGNGPSLFLVPLMQRDSGILAVMDAESRAYLQSVVVSRGLVETLRIPPAALADLVGGAVNPLANDRRAERVWQPCKESTTPLRCFMRFEAAGQLAFVRLFDRRVFRSLSFSGA